MSINDIFKVVVSQNYLGEDMENVFFYRQTSEGPGTAEDVYGAFTDQIWDEVRKVQSMQVLTLEYNVQNGMTPSDWYVSIASAAGEYNDGYNLPPQIALGFRSPSGGPGTRYSYKKIGGCRTAAIDSGGSGGFSTAFKEGYLALVEPLLGTSLEGDDAAYAPCSVHGAWVIGTPPVFGRYLQGQWSANETFVGQRTRQKYLWVQHFAS